MQVIYLEEKKVFHNTSISFQLWSVSKKILKTNKKFCEKKEQDIPYFLLRINQTLTYSFGHTTVVSRLGVLHKHKDCKPGSSTLCL